ncbi:unnamed protein product [Hymenolepis diminuta]|uniref:Zer-1-like leucine-rich repeats region domain-containing protein n=1 Tax=Hymenolepis diminuta TaxID=6216 RepID=A0A564Z1Z8_HYMDI|nr:unnamed protein product [Hymenolepis diminuta]
MQSPEDSSTIGPPPLKRQCVRSIAENLNSVIQKCHDDGESKFVWRFPYPDCHIAHPEAETILEELGSRKTLRKEHLTLFSRQNVELNSVSLQDIDLTPQSLSILKDFTLLKITAEDVRGITLKDLTDNLSEDTFRALQSLNIRKMPFEEEAKLSIPVALGAFQNLQCLNISGTEVDSVCLGELVKRLPRLRNLDISETLVDDISSLIPLKENLTTLNMHRLPLKIDSGFKTALSVIAELKELRVLDISNFRHSASSNLPETDFFSHTNFLPHLKRLDMSGNPFLLSKTAILDFMENHPTLEFLGLIDSGLNLRGLYKSFPAVEIVGGKTEEQLTKVIKHCTTRPCYFVFAFQSISKKVELDEFEIEEYDEICFTTNLLELVISTLEKQELNLECLTEGMESTSYLYKCLSFEDIPTELLNRLMNLTFLVMEKVNDELLAYWCRDILVELKNDENIVFDNKRFCNILFYDLNRFLHADIRLSAIELLFSTCLPDMTESDLNELSKNPFHIECLLKNAAEIYLDESEVCEILTDCDDDKLTYLRNFRKCKLDGFMTVRSNMSNLFKVIKQLLLQTKEACKTALDLGVLEVLVKILEKHESNVKMAKNTACIAEILESLAEKAIQIGEKIQCRF